MVIIELPNQGKNLEEKAVGVGPKNISWPLNIKSTVPIPVLSAHLCLSINCCCYFSKRKKKGKKRKKKGKAKDLSLSLAHSRTETMASKKNK